MDTETNEGLLCRQSELSRRLQAHTCNSKSGVSLLPLPFHPFIALHSAKPAVVQ